MLIEANYHHVYLKKLFDCTKTWALPIEKCAKLYSLE